MRVLIVGNSAKADDLAEELTGADRAVERHPDDPPLGSGPDEVGQIAEDLRELEHVLGGSRLDAVLVASDSSAALAAVLVATKLEVPVARLEIPGVDSAGRNAGLIAQLADAVLAPEPTAIVNWVTGTEGHSRRTQPT